ncbi:hypothetical protein TPA0909_28740 [Streptomyces albus]|nr:hypothetical protein TPA0909_28740 [Streptomyces albus]
MRVVLGVRDGDLPGHPVPDSFDEKVHGNGVLLAVQTVLAPHLGDAGGVHEAAQSMITAAPGGRQPPTVP